MDNTRRSHPSFLYDQANLLDDILMKWAFRLVSFYRKEVPNETNSIEIPTRLRFEEGLEALRHSWEDEKKKKNPSLLKALWKVMSKDFYIAVIPGMIGYNSLLVSTVLMIYIINYMNSSDEPVGNIIGYIIAYAIVIQFNSFCLNYSNFRCFTLTAKIKWFLSHILYEKTLKTFYGELSQGDQAGKLSSLISSDLEFFEGLAILPYMFDAPFFLFVSGFLLWYNIGVSGIIGLIVAVFHIPIIINIGKNIGKYRFLSAAIGDTRMKMITNLIEGIRIIKLYGWEHPYLESLFAKRGLEISQIKKKGLVSCFSRSINYGSTGLVLFVTFSVYIALGNELKISTAFSSIVILMLCTSLINLVGGMGIMILFLVITSLKRFTNSLLLEDRPLEDYEGCSSHSLRVKDCVFSWKKPEIQTKVESEVTTMRNNTKIWTLKTIAFRCKPGELIIVIGSVGSGKTALFMGLLKEICTLEGTIAKNGKFAFASEESWIISGTIRENILMDQDYNEDWYNKVIKACSLERDFDLFNEYRDQTMIGDRGITLSGGQKARISLARAVYTNREIYLLDDPLSAVDPEVCNDLFNLCIRGILSGKTVILATHQAHFVSQADKILILEDGNQIFFGTYEELNEQDLSSYLGKISQALEQENENEKNKKEELPEETKIAIKDIKSILEEERSTGTVPLKVYWKYLMLGYKNWFFFLAALMIQIVAQVSYLSIIFWIAYWSNAADQKDPSYVLWMGILVIILYILTFIRQTVFQFPLINCAKNLHNLALTGITLTKSVFFDKNPTGRMLNRFAKDTSQMDETLIVNIGESIISFSLVFGNFVAVVIIAPYTLIPLAGLAFYIYLLFQYFAKPNKALRRYELVTKSPVLTLLNTSIHGLSTIRCLNLEKKFLSDMTENIKLNLQTYISFQVSLRGLQMYLEMGPNLLSVINIIVLVLMKDSIKPGLAGMSISLTITIMGYMGYLFRTIIETDNYMISPQRLFDYTSLETEGKLIESDTFRITEGRIEVQHIFMKYRENYDYALKDLSFTIEPKMKTGIIGRTGAGKSSIMQVLFRLVNPEKGYIYIDGQDYMKAGLHEIRKQMSVIPQSATLFIASLKDNLDPFHSHTDEEIISVLEKVELGTLLKELPDGLETQINSKGLSLSAGQKQLVCLARAILRENKIVMIDEATANVDSRTDEIIQTQLLERFKDSTVLIIAHRLRTVIDSDWIVVMDQGCTKEEGPPKELVKNSESFLLKMIMHTGPSESQYLLSKLSS